MGYYNVVKPCVVGKLHYARPTTQPIEVDEEVAAPLVADGSLEPYRPGDRISGSTGTVLDGILQNHPDLTEIADAMEPTVIEGELAEPKPRRSRRRTTED